MIITIFKDIYDDTVGSSGDLNEQIGQIYTDLNTQRANYSTSNSTAETTYLTDYSKLQQIYQNTASGGFDWANASIEDIISAQNGAAHGMLINFYRTLIPAKWQVLWCTGSEYPNCGPVDTPGNYDCSFGGVQPGLLLQHAGVHFYGPAALFSSFELEFGR
ncbi:MAG: hypothetical protein ACR2JB_01700 [Bryobacteraceae bacterium]